MCTENHLYLLTKIGSEDEKIAKTHRAIAVQIESRIGAAEFRGEEQEISEIDDAIVIKIGRFGLALALPDKVHQGYLFEFLCDAARPV